MCGTFPWKKKKKTFFCTQVTCAAHVSKSIKKWKCTPLLRCYVVRDCESLFSKSTLSSSSSLGFFRRVSFLFPFRICFLLLLIWLKWSKHRNLGKLYFVISCTRDRFSESRVWVWVCVMCVDDRSTVLWRAVRCMRQTQHDKTTTNTHRIKGENCQIKLNTREMPVKIAKNVNGTSIPFIFQRRRPVCRVYVCAAIASLFLVEIFNALRHRFGATRTKSYAFSLLIFSFSLFASLFVILFIFFFRNEWSERFAVCVLCACNFII